MVALSVTTVTDERAAAPACGPRHGGQPDGHHPVPTSVAAHTNGRLSHRALDRGQVGFFTVPTSVTFTGPHTGPAREPLLRDLRLRRHAAVHDLNSAPSVHQHVGRPSAGQLRITPGRLRQQRAFAVTDAVGRTTTVTVSNELGRGIRRLRRSRWFPSLSLNSCVAPPTPSSWVAKPPARRRLSSGFVHHGDGSPSGGPRHDRSSVGTGAVERDGHGERRPIHLRRGGFAWHGADGPCP